MLMLQFIRQEIYSRKEVLMVISSRFSDLCSFLETRLTFINGLIVGACMASVIFGIGKEKFRTDCVKGNNPTWNEESSM